MMIEDIRRDIAKKDRIGINIFYNSKINLEGRLSNILWGIEEEEIPFVLIPVEETNAEILGSRASRESKLGVGIGIGEREVTLYQEKLEMDKPLFRYTIDSDESILRALGVNGARLIKGNPFIIPEMTGGKR